MEGQLNICKSIMIIQHINRVKGKNYRIVTINAEKPLTEVIIPS
jgi:hypothetical protein